MKFRVTSYRGGIRLLKDTKLFSEILQTLESITIESLDDLRKQRQAAYPKKKAGIQHGLNRLIKEGLAAKQWNTFVPVFSPDKKSKKGLWVMDFAKSSSADAGLSVGVEATFNHAEALTWTPIRLTLAHEAEDVLPGARISVGCIIIGTDDLKGKGKTKRMDGAVGTYERLVTVMPKMRAVVPTPLVILGLDWANGGREGDVKELDLHTSKSSGYSSATGPTD